MKKLAIVFAVIIAVLYPASTAAALPRSWVDSKATTQNGVTYRVRKDGVAAVTKVARKNAVIKREVKYHGKWYEVRAIWPDACKKNVQTVAIHADLEVCEDTAIWNGRVLVKAVRKSDYRWFKHGGAVVLYTPCKHCN